MEIFLKKNELSLINGGYLVGKNDIAVNHYQFVNLQNEAHYLVSLSQKIKDVSFKTTSVKSFAEYVNETKKEIENENRVYLQLPESPGTPTMDILQKEATAWLNSKDNEVKTEKINRIMQKFNTIAEFEEFGLYFNTEQTVKLKKIYTLEEILNAVNILEPQLNEGANK